MMQEPISDLWLLRGTSTVSPGLATHIIATWLLRLVPLGEKPQGSAPHASAARSSASRQTCLLSRRSSIPFCSVASPMNAYLPRSERTSDVVPLPDLCPGVPKEIEP